MTGEESERLRQDPKEEKKGTFRCPATAEKGGEEGSEIDGIIYATKNATRF